MTFSFKRFNAIFIKELQDFRSNINYLVICLLPMFLAFIYKMIFSNTLLKYSLVFTTIMSVSMIGIIFSAGTFSEEKEKHTLRVLMLSPLSELEIFLGKTLLTYILILLSSFGNLLILNPSDLNILMFIIVVSLAGYGSILFGITIGMLAPSEKASSVLSLPIVFLYLIPIFFIESGNVLIKKITSVLPHHNIISILMPEMLSNNANSIFLSILYLVLWIVFGLILFIVIYRKKKIQ
ncbi:ABC transporter permease [Oceanirhabdus sp. W0125-5]|uniref:ABC transporter permease n=1 Tax=Oceanirhabdus sp. W0125-5 TaxID=2999116 RepID=UPI0022F2F7F2|nr:ABC transporter permease [Oceanirhabdus sp. W0125-5]WBW96446.1 ABC transporter permease [Oceanirhabdus sp. W0125-5]